MKRERQREKDGFREDSREGSRDRQTDRSILHWPLALFKTAVFLLRATREKHAERQEDESLLGYEAKNWR